MNFSSSAGFFLILSILILISCPTVLVDAATGSNATVSFFNYSSSSSCAASLAVDQFATSTLNICGNTNYTMSLVCTGESAVLSLSCAPTTVIATASGVGDAVTCLTAHPVGLTTPLFNVIIDCNQGKLVDIGYNASSTGVSNISGSTAMSNMSMMSSSSIMNGMSNTTSMMSSSSTMMPSGNNSMGSSGSSGMSSAGFYTSSYMNGTSGLGSNGSPSTYSFSFWAFALITVISSALLIGIN